MKNGYWVVTLKDAKAIKDDRCNYCFRGRDEIELHERLIVTEKVKKGFLFWKKEVEEAGFKYNALYFIPRENIVHIKWIDKKEEK